MKHTAILLIHCPDSTGLVARVSSFLFEHRGNILHGRFAPDGQTVLYSASREGGATEIGAPSKSWRKPACAV